MSITVATITELDASLYRGDGGWYWVDGTFEPRVRDLLLEELTPAWRCLGRGPYAWVEVPTEWRSRVCDPELTRALTELVRHYADIGPIRDQGAASTVGERGQLRSGYRVPLSAWRIIMREPCGAVWDRSDDAAIHAIARSLGAREREA
jgi:hypothetical protein